MLMSCGSFWELRLRRLREGFGRGDDPFRIAPGLLFVGWADATTSLELRGDNAFGVARAWAMRVIK
jgi:hypothetical protein